jgi:hypothetical protein
LEDDHSQGQYHKPDNVGCGRDPGFGAIEARIIAQSLVSLPHYTKMMNCVLVEDNLEYQKMMVLEEAKNVGR